MRRNKLVIGDTEYEITPAYRKGAQAMRSRIPFNVGNPYRLGTQNDFDWNAGHTNESAANHFVEGVDVITAPRTGQAFTAAD